MKSFLLTLAALGFGLLMITDVEAGHRHCRRHHRRGGDCNSSYSNGYNGYSYNTSPNGTYVSGEGRVNGDAARVDVNANVNPGNVTRATGSDENR